MCTSEPSHCVSQLAREYAACRATLLFIVESTTREGRAMMAVQCSPSIAFLRVRFQCWKLKRTRCKRILDPRELAFTKCFWKSRQREDRPCLPSIFFVFTICFSALTHEEDSRIVYLFVVDFDVRKHVRVVEVKRVDFYHLFSSFLLYFVP